MRWPDPQDGYGALVGFTRREDVSLGRAVERVMALARRGTLFDHLFPATDLPV